MRETSLEDFLDGSKAAGESIAGEAPEDASNERADPSGETAEGSERDTENEGHSDLATATYAWTPERANCAACGTAVERRWRDDGRLVCADCKNW
jgi:hypothetical protein